MAYDAGLAERIREALQDTPGVSERKMFGGLAFMVRGNMCCGIVGSELMLRVGPAHYAAVLALPHARAMDFFTGKPMQGLVYVAKAGLAEDADLKAWVERGLAFVATLPEKAKG